MFYVVLPYNDNQVVDDLVAFSEEQWLAVEYAKEWDCYDISIAEYDVSDKNTMFESLCIDCDVRIDDSYEINLYRLSIKPPDRYYLYTDSQFLSMSEYSPTISEEYLEETLSGIYGVKILCDYLSDQISEKLNTVINYILYKYMVRVVLFNKTDISNFQDFIEKSGMASSGHLSKYKGGYVVADDDILNMGMIIKLCMGMYRPG